MMQTRSLDVYLRGEPVGRLDYIGPADYRLTYNDRLAAQTGADPLSLSLPISRRVHRGPALRNYLDNLLPDDDGVRRRWATEAGLDSHDPFELLSAYGADVAGAAEFYPAGSARSTDGAFEPVGEADIARKIRAIHADQFAWTDPEHAGGRFSLGGAQGKFALAWRDQAWWEPSGVQPSTHIFKPGVRGIKDAEVVEYVLMTSARLLGLPAAEVQLMDFQGERSLVIQRFDRVEAEYGRVLRLRQEDLCQAFGLSSLRKYEVNNGPGSSQILALLRRIRNPDRARVATAEFVRALLFSWLVLNTDAHLKNYSIQLASGTFTLAPLYDVSSMLPYLKLQDQSESSLLDAYERTVLSMRLVESYFVGEMIGFEWRGLAREAGLDRDEFLAWARELCVATPLVVQAVINSLAPTAASEVTSLLADRIVPRAAQALASLGKAG